MSHDAAREGDANNTAAEYARLRSLLLPTNFQSDFTAVSVLEVAEADAGSTASRAFRTKSRRIHRLMQGAAVLNHEVVTEYKAICILLTITRARDLLLLKGDRRGEGFRALADGAIFVTAVRETSAATVYAEGRIAALNAQYSDRRPPPLEAAMMQRYSNFVASSRGRARAEDARSSSGRRSADARQGSANAAEQGESARRARQQRTAAAASAAEAAAAADADATRQAEREEAEAAASAAEEAAASAAAEAEAGATPVEAATAAEYHRLYGINPTTQFDQDAVARRILELRPRTSRSEESRAMRAKCKEYFKMIQGARRLRHPVPVEYMAISIIQTCTRAKDILIYRAGTQTPAALNIIADGALFVAPGSVLEEASVWASAQIAGHNGRYGEFRRAPPEAVELLKRYTDFVRDNPTRRSAAASAAQAANAQAENRRDAEAAAAAAAAAATAERQRTADAAAAAAEAEAAATAERQRNAEAAAASAAAEAAAGRRRDADAAASAAADAAQAIAARREAQERAEPALPTRRPSDTACPYSAIDVVDVNNIIVNEFEFKDDVPKEYVVEWACAMADALERIEEASVPLATTAEHDRALLWQMGLHQFLLRKAPKSRGGRRSGNVYAKRFADWREGRFNVIIEDWEHDRRLIRAQNRPFAPDGSGEITKALKLIRECELSKACKTLSNAGLGDLGDPHIVEQIRRKTPPRKEEILTSWTDFESEPDLLMDLEDTYRNLDRRVGTGPNGLKNEYLTVLARSFPNRRAREVLGRMNTFQTRVINGRGMPSWYYYADSAITACAPIKDKNAPLNENGVPDCRPVGAGNTARRATARFLQATVKVELGEALYPTQTAVGVASGISALVFGLRAGMEAHPDWLLAKTDKPNAFNEVKRAKAIKACIDLARSRGGQPPIAARAGMILGRAQFLYNSPKSLIVLAGPRTASNTPTVADFRSEEGIQQGDGLGMAEYGVATLTANEALDSFLQSSVSTNAEDGDDKGIARFFADDGFIFAPPEITLAAIKFYEEEIQPLGEKLKASGCEVYCPALGADLAFHPALGGRVTRSLEDGVSVARVDGIRIAEDGVNICGVFVGERDYVKRNLDSNMEGTRSYIENIVSKLQPFHSQSLHALVLYCLSGRVDYTMQHQYPSDSRRMAVEFDEAISRAESAALGPAGPLIYADEHAEARMRLPVRRGGGGLRKRQPLRLAAFLGNLSAVAPMLIDREVMGETKRGFAPCLEKLFGGDAFDGREDRFGTLLRGQQGRLAIELEHSWDSMQREVGLAEESTITSGPLLARAECAGWSDAVGSVIPKLQKALTAQREDAALSVVKGKLLLLDDFDPRRASFVSGDRFSNSIMLAVPTSECAISNVEFSEVVANHFGVASPACLLKAGQPIRRAPGVVLDPHGRALMNDTRLLNLNSARTIWHDTNLHHVVEGLREAKIPHRMEVFGLFANACSDGGDAMRADSGLRSLSKQRSMVPDLMFSDPDDRDSEELIDLKTISHSRSSYNRARIRGEISAVNARAAKVNDEYDKHAVDLDHRFNGCPLYETDQATGDIRRHQNGSKVRSTQVGPVRALLRTYGAVKGLVYGSFGEAGDDVHSTLKIIAGRIARENWMEMGARNQPEAEAALSSRFYREWGIGNARGRSHAVLSILNDAFGNGTSGGSSSAYAAQFRRYHQARHCAYVNRQGPRVTPPPRWGRHN
jgi:hypothetical protein